MWNLLHLSLRILIGFTGVACLLISLFLYPGEEGKMQSVLEDLWTKLDDRHKAALSLHTAFMREVALLETRYFDLLFGHRLFSLRAFGVSISYSVASVATVGLSFTFFTNPVQKRSSGNIVELFCLACLFVVFLFGGSVPALFPKFRFVKTWFICVITLAFVLCTYAFAEHAEDILIPKIFMSLAVSSLLIIVASFGCDILFIAATRQALRWAGEMNHFFTIALIVLLNCLLAICLVVAPLWWGFGVMPDDILGALVPVVNPQFLNAVIMVSASNTIGGLVASVFIVLSVLLLVHRMFWPLLNRSVFRIQEIGSKGRRALLVSIGLMLFGAATGDKVADWVREIVEAVKG